MTGPAQVSQVRQLYWLVLRELWEHRSIYTAPAAVAVLIMAGSAISVIGPLGSLPASGPAQQLQVVEQRYEFAALLMMFTTIVIAFYYCLEAFQSERRDRSILFWKSLPVSDFTTVAAKASVPLFILPLVAFAATVVTHVFMLFLGAPWRVVPVLSMWTGLFYHLVAGHGLWYAPFYGWLFLVSAWARRAPLLWATLPLLALGLVERIAFNTSHFAAMLLGRFAAAPVHEGAPDPMLMGAPTPVQLVNNPGFWLGLAFCVLCLAGAARLRRERGPSF